MIRTSTRPSALSVLSRSQTISSGSASQELTTPSTSPIESLILCITLPREERRARITARLRQRLDEGDLIGEVQRLIDSGIAPEDLIYYGLEYKFVTQHLLGELTRDELFTALETAIHQFAKRQMTWFRGMERRGFTLHYIDGLLPREEPAQPGLRVPQGMGAEVARPILPTAL